MRVFKASHVCLATVKWLSSNRKPPCFRKCSQTNPSCIRQWKGCPLHNNLINGCADRTAGFSPRTGPRHSRQNSGLLTAHRSPPQQTEQRASHRAQVPATADRTAGFSPRTGPRHSRQNSGLLTAHRSPPQQTDY